MLIGFDAVALLIVLWMSYQLRLGPSFSAQPGRSSC